MRHSEKTSRSLWQKTDVTLITCCVLAACALLASCASPPAPSAVDESTRRPLNNRTSLDLQVCRTDLSKAQAALTEVQLFARNSSSAQADPGAMASKPQAPEPQPTVCNQTPHQSPSNETVVVPFVNNSFSLQLRPDDVQTIMQKASQAAYIVIRGRTDSTRESMSETSLARRRADAAASLLIGNGTPASKLRVTWQGFGDGLAASAAQNRRVELEFYPAKPTTTLLQHDSPAR